MTTILERHFDIVALHDKPVVQEEKVSPTPVCPIEEIAEKWIKQFDAAITAQDSDSISVLFQDNGTFYSFFISWQDGGAMFWRCHGISTLINLRNQSGT